MFRGNKYVHCRLSDFQSPSVASVNETSITLQWNELPPELTGNPQRNITQYAVTISSQDGRHQEDVFIPAEDIAVYNFRSLQPATTYNIKVNIVIDTAGQGEQTYDIGVSPLIVTTCE